jgi:hypothetical protein
MLGSAGILPPFHWLGSHSGDNSRSVHGGIVWTVLQPLDASSDIGIFVQRPEPERLASLDMGNMRGRMLVLERPSPAGSSLPLMTLAACRLEGTSSPYDDQPDSHSQVMSSAETDHASIHGYHGEGTASAFRFLTLAIHRLGRAYRRWTLVPGETEPPPSP